MRIRYRDPRKLNAQRAGALLAMLIPMTVLGSVVGHVAGLFEEIPSFGFSDALRPDPATFVPANYSMLAEMALAYDYRFETYHIPNNFTVDTYFGDDALTVPTWYGYSDNGALWTGSSLVAFVGKYLAGVEENDTTLRDNATRVMRKLVHGMSMMLEVPNGGLGPQFGATVARSWASPEQMGVVPGPGYIPGIQYLLNDGPAYPKYFNGTGPYSQYRWSGFTSNDEYGGYYMGIAIAYKFLNKTHAPDVHDKLGIMIDQLCAGMLRANFLGFTGSGGTTGVDQKMRAFSGSSWMMLVLKMGALAHPEKYESTYYHILAENLQGFFAGAEGGSQEIVSNYYAYNFGFDVLFGLLMLEEDPVLLDRFVRNLDKTMWRYVRYHRNPYFNAMYMAIQRSTHGNMEVLERDIEDQLMEFKINHFPDTRQGRRPAGAGYELVDFSPYRDFLENSTAGALFRPVFMEFNLNEKFWNKPLTVSMRHTSIFMWDGNPFKEITSNGTNYRHESPGMSFSAPYWIARGFCGMPAAGMRDAWIG